jgi:phosphatidylinositol-3-phosphatase
MTRRALRGMALALVAAASMSACGHSGKSAGGPGDGTPSVRATGSSASTAATAPPTRTVVTKLLVVVIENHSEQAATQGMPHLAKLGKQYGTAAKWFALTHPSLPNYLAIAGGSTFSVHDDGPPSEHRLPGQSVFGQVLSGGGTAKTYAEGMSRNCQTQNAGRYAVKHNAWAYFMAPQERSACRRYDVPAGTPVRGLLHDDIATGRLPTFSMLIPDMCHNAHDCTLSAADDWLRAWTDALLSGRDFRSGRLAVVVTFDEDDHHAGNHVLTVVLHRSLHGMTVRSGLNHYDLSRSASQLAGKPPLAHARGAADALAAFHLTGVPAGSSR